MLVHELPLLRPEILTLRPVDRDFDPAAWRINEEVVVREEAGDILMRQGDRMVRLALTARSGAADAYVQDRSTIWVLARVKQTSVGFRCGPPSDSHRPQQAIDIGVDQRVADDLQMQRRIVAATPAAAMAWLSDEFICPGSVEGTARVFAARMSRAKQDQLQLIGRGAAVDIERAGDGRLVVQRIRPRRRNELDAYTVLEGDIRFVELDEGMRVQSGDERATLGAAVTSYGTYLELWQLYSEMEWRRDVAKAAELGALRYTRLELASQEGGAWRFYAPPASIAEFRSKWRSLGLEVDASLEAEDVAPDWRSDRYADLSTADSTRRFRGNPEFGQDSVVLQTRSPIDPPEMGYLFLSLAGDRKQHERRLHARKAIEAGIGVPRLRALLQDLPISGQRPSRFPALTPYARQSFKSGRPTARQEEAMRVALNTPDVALIIGPPGTGKTQVIAALERRFAELNEGSVIAHEVLVSSFQHDAVENALERTDVYGLPAIKVGSRSAPEDAVDRWCAEQRRKATERLAEVVAAEPHVPLMQELDRLSAGLRLGSIPATRFDEAIDRITSLVDELARSARLRVSASWLQDWEEYVQERLADASQFARQMTPFRRRHLTRLTRALRTQTESFADDGVVRAAALQYEAADNDGLLSKSETELLHEAQFASLITQDLLDRLAALQGLLLDRLRPDLRPAVIRHQLDPAGTLLLERLQNELATKSADKKFGRYSVLRRYCDAIESDRARIRRTVEQYSSIVGATCQQAASIQMSKLKSVGADAAESIQFNTVVIDEAARANPLDLFIPMSMAKRRIVLVGDHRQLPHLLDPEVEEDAVRLHGEADRAVYQQSLFERLWRQLKKREAIDGFSRVVMLDTQFRMHPTLGDFVSRNFYEAVGLDHIQSGRKAEDFCESVPGFGSVTCAWIDVPAHKGREERHQSSRQRTSEATRIAAEVRRLANELPPDMSIGVITFYAAQRDRIFEELSRFGIAQFDGSEWQISPEHVRTEDCPERLRIGTVDAFQGKEFDVVLLSAVRSNDFHVGVDAADDDAAFQKAASRKYGHLRVSNRLNVAMSRQRRLLVVIGDRAMFAGPDARTAVPEMSAFLELCDKEAHRAQ